MNILNKNHYPQCPDCKSRLVRVIDDQKGLEADKCHHCGHHSDWRKMPENKARSPS